LVFGGGKSGGFQGLSGGFQEYRIGSTATHKPRATLQCSNNSKLFDNKVMCGYGVTYVMPLS
jgi:hypothetical protein